ncbi:glutamate receptor-like [Procambarus clarkii]|uniref:glutamate receptor-like n=1 Tax=Procambarus clarkii TaxID=6728 RepID=UPI003741F2F5
MDLHHHEPRRHRRIRIHTVNTRSPAVTEVTNSAQEEDERRERLGTGRISSEPCERVRDGGWGSQVQGEWGGMVGELVRGEADIAVAALDITHKRSTAVDFLLGFLYSKYQLVMRRPSSSDYVWTAYIKQMENRAWAAMGAVVVLSLLVTTLVVICSGRRGHHISLSDTLITVLGFLMGQGGNVGLMPASLCVVAVTCLLLHQLLLAHYNSGLITALAVGPPLTLISNLNDINRNPSLTLGYVKGSSLTEHFKCNWRWN